MLSLSPKSKSFNTGLKPNVLCRLKHYHVRIELEKVRSYSGILLQIAALLREANLDDSVAQAHVCQSEHV